MEILNIVSIYGGVIDHIKSFKISSKIEKTKKKQIVKAEEYFKQLIKNDNNIVTENELNDFIDNGYYTDDNGYDLYLIWSILE